MLGLMPKRFDDVDIQVLAARNEFPETLTTEFLKIALVRRFIASIATAIDCAYVQLGLSSSGDACRFFEIVTHLVDLAAVAPIGT